MARPKGSADLLEDRRRRALALVDSGCSLNEAARRIGCGASSVMRWYHARRRGGGQALRVRFSPGRPPKLQPKTAAGPDQAAAQMADGAGHRSAHGPGVRGRMAHGRFEKVSLGIPPGLISSFLEDSDQSLWIATYGNGVFRLQNGNLRAFSGKDGLPDNRVVRLYRDRSGKIWTVGLKGISTWNGTRFVGHPAVNSVVTLA